jgi:hypothetical protein
MADLALEQINDLVLGTLKELGRARFQQIAQKLQTYIVVGKWFRKDKVKFDEGLGIQRNLMISTSNQARHTGIMTTDSVDIPSLMAQLSIQWRHAQNGWSFGYQEILVNRGKSLIFNIIQPRRVDALISMAAELEAKAWTLAPNGDVNLPWGIPFWVVYPGNQSTPDFAGGYPSGYTTLAGIDLTAAPTFKNYAGQYTNVTKADLISTMRAGHRKLFWMPPINVADYRRGEYGDLQLYTDNTTFTSLEALGEGQNENLGRDIAPFGAPIELKYIESVLTFRRHPIHWVPQLDDTGVYTAATNPVYMIDHSTFYPVCLEGDFLRESPVLRAPAQHNVFRVFIDLSYNYLCVDRRRNAVFSKN